MSAQHAPHDDADAPAPVDPYDIVPDSFTDDWNAETIPAALAKAEAAPSTTNPREQERCPNCLAARLTPLPDDRGADWACTECNRRHDAVLPSQTEAARQAGHAPDTERESALPRCRGCLSTALYPVPERAPLDAMWGCRRCGETFDDALPSERAMTLGDPSREVKAAVKRARQRRESIDPDELRTPERREVEPIPESEQAGFDEVVEG